MRAVAKGVDLNVTLVGDVASREPVTVGPEEDLDEALRLMARHQVRRLPVVDEQRLVGVLAQADVAAEAKASKTGEVVEGIAGCEKCQWDRGRLAELETGRDCLDQASVDDCGARECRPTQPEDTIPDAMALHARGHFSDDAREFEAEERAGHDRERVENVAEVDARGLDGDAHLALLEATGHVSNSRQPVESAALGDLQVPRT